MKHNRLKFNVIVSPLYGVFTPETPWLGYIVDAHFESPIRTKNYLEALTQKGAKNTIQITNQNFISGSLYLPRNVDEQTRIADCLSSLESLIAAQMQKLDALRSHKRGLLQQMFPTEGETAPRLRFPEFKGAGEWGEVELGDIAEIKLGKMLDKNKHTLVCLLPYLNNLAVRWNEVNTADLPQMYFDHHELDRFGLKAGGI